MNLLEWVHETHGANRRLRVLADHLSSVLPAGASVLDVGCGDGSLASAITDRRSDVTFHGIEVLLRRNASIPTSRYNGRRIPFPDRSFDVVMMIDVLHHTSDPMVLLREASRVSSRAVILKDHLRDGIFAGPTLRLMDRVGNCRHGVAVPFNFWSHKRWMESFISLGLQVVYWRKQLQLYPWPASCFFDRSLHFLACLSSPVTHRTPRVWPGVTSGAVTADAATCVV